jgi:hypothetical protein
VSVEAVISFSDQFFVETFFADARFVSCHEQDCLTLPIESKATLHSPSAALKKTQLLHIRVARAIQRISARSLQLRPKLLEKPSHCQNLRLHVFVQGVERRLNSLPISTTRLTAEV